MHETEQQERVSSWSISLLRYVIKYIMFAASCPYASVPLDQSTASCLLKAVKSV